MGGGNSAGQAAVFLSGRGRQVHMLVRGAGLAESMSRYLIRRIEETPNITLRTRTRIEALEGDAHLERVTLARRRTGARTTADIRHVFLMTGADPNTAWLRNCVALDEKGFVKTGPDLLPDELEAAGWPLARARRCSSRRASRASSPSATCAPTASSAWPPRWARARSAFSSSTRCSPPRGYSSASSASSGSESRGAGAARPSVVVPAGQGRLLPREVVSHVWGADNTSSSSIDVTKVFGPSSSKRTTVWARLDAVVTPLRRPRG